MKTHIVLLSLCCLIIGQGCTPLMHTPGVWPVVERLLAMIAMLLQKIF